MVMSRKSMAPSSLAGKVGIEVVAQKRLITACLAKAEKPQELSKWGAMLSPGRFARNHARADGLAGQSTAQSPALPDDVVFAAGFACSPVCCLPVCFGRLAVAAARR